MTSFTEENYLKTIYHLNTDENGTVSTNSISESLQTKAASVTDMLKKLADKELINYAKYQGVTLTALGKQKAISIIRKHRLWEVFLVDKLNFKWDEVHDLAEELEHINSEILINRLDEFLNFPENDPHGDPIPDKNGILKSQELVPVSKMNIGDEGKISGVREHSKNFLQYLEKTGLTLGCLIKIVDKIAFDDSVIIEIHSKEQTISREVAKNLLVAI
ncbi:metal-dependent transcriptional regulator [Pelobium sp.]|nr:metal-dependent transcriptional regulator [Pelobium sp.]MDA9555846.1 metal-dependent transcriptional regulator [Pelobium sp.]